MDNLQRYIGALNKLASGAELNEAPVLAEAVECLENGYLDQTLIALNKLDLWLKQGSPWHDQVRELYNEIRDHLINEFK